MKITVSDRYYHDADCDVADCECRYCKEHRMLWRDCDTAEETYDGAGQSWWELRDCPECQRDYHARQTKRFIREWEASHEQKKPA